MSLTQMKGKDKDAQAEVIRLLAEIDQYLKENNSILKQNNAILKGDHELILDMADNIRKIKINTQY